MSRPSFARYLLIISLGLSSLFGIGLASLRAYDKTLITVKSSSMMPAFGNGDALVVSQTKHQSLKPGDVVSYKSPSDSSLVISHRVVETGAQTGTLRTAGDASNELDPPFRPEQVVGQVVAVAPKLGFAIDTATHPAAAVIMLYLPASIIIISEIQYLCRAYSRPFYELRC